ncbi:MAG TPA: hypothetical protein VFT22_38775 [Kofleriaceae bacterium]|nr:hypothetical protein [Kofleriaceae bacterium]
MLHQVSVRRAFLGGEYFASEFPRTSVEVSSGGSYPAAFFLPGFARNFIAFLDVIRQGRGPSQGQLAGGEVQGFPLRYQDKKAMETDKSMTRPVLRRADDDNDGLVALPPVPLVRQRLRSSVKEFAISQPGRRAAALAAVWIAATGCEADLGHYDPEEALRTYRLIESELRAELRISLGRAITNEPHAATRNTMISMLEHLEELEAAAVAPRPARRRRRR